MSDDQPKVGVIGLGVGVHAHVPTLRAAGFEVAALAARRIEPLQAAGAETGVAALYTDVDALLAHPGLDAVTIATPPPSHHELVLKALRAGKHVLVEKAFATSAAEADEMREGADAAGKTGMVAQAYRFAPSRAFVASLLDSGYIGAPRHIAISYFWSPPPQMHQLPDAHWRFGSSTGGGLSGGHAATLFDAVTTWFGPVKTIGGKLRVHDVGRRQMNGRPADADDTFSCTFETVSGLLGSMVVSGVAPLGPGGRIEIYGSEGQITIHQPAIVPTPQDRVTAARLADGPETRELPIPAEFQISQAEGRSVGPTYQPFFPLMAAFRRGIETGASPSPNFADSCHLQRISDALRKASREGRFIDV